MKIYCAEFHDKDLGNCLSWHPNKRDAEKALRVQEKQRTEGDSDSSLDKVREHEVPTTRTELINWLNEHFTRDNG